LNNLHYEHIGSTSIPGIKAKPIIDIIVGVEKFPPGQGIVKCFEDYDYIYMKEMSVADRLYFIKRGGKNFNVHIISYNGVVWRNDILFRNYLIANPLDAEAYSLLKEKIIGEGNNTLLEYSSLKADFIKRIYEKINNSDYAANEIYCIGDARQPGRCGGRL
jgi:GrpB-like predicted nucleotidyltransferase (UPF0157 family)